MDFAEEKTPGGILIKILLNKWQFLAFDSKGRSIYRDDEGRNMIHHVPIIIFLGKKINFKRDYEKEYHLLKIRKGNIIVPYIDTKTHETKYLFIPTDKKIDLIPVRMFYTESVARMVKEIDITMKPDYCIIDDEITQNDIIIVKNRYKIDEENIFRIADSDENKSSGSKEEKEIKEVNINMLSTNPVYLALVHLRKKDISKINQLLLDFEITELDTEYILTFINDYIEEFTKKNSGDKSIYMLKDLLNLYSFYRFLLQRDDEKIKEIVNSLSDLKEIASYKTLISKVKSLYPGSDDQILFTEYENIIADKWEELKEEASG